MRTTTQPVAVPTWKYLRGVLALTLLFTACAPDGGPDLPDPDDPDPEFPLIDLTEPPRTATAWEMLADTAEDDGTVSKTVALQAFALTLGDIPGVTPPTADTIGAHCGSIALRWLAQHADTLTDDELAAINAALNPEGDTAHLAQARLLTDESCTLGNEGISEDGEGAEQYRPMVNQELAKLELSLGASLGIPVYLTLGLGKSGSDTLAWASPQSANGCNSPATSCRMELLVNREELANETQLRATISHELVHCFQATWLPVNEALSQPDWLLEGFADYAGESLNPSAPRVWFVVYAETPLRRLYTRTYDAQGFFFHLDTIGVNVFANIVDAFKLKGSSAAFAHLIQPASTEFGETWASSYALEPGRGEAWHMLEAPAHATPKYSSGTIVNGKSYEGNPGPAGTRISHLDFDADVVRFKAGGDKNGRISWDDGGEIVLAAIDGQDYCRKAGGCECPEGTTGSPPQTPIPSLGAIVSVTGTTVTSSVEVQGVSLDDYCRDEPDPTPTPAPGIDPCVVGRWVSDEWTLPGPISDLDGSGGNNAVVTIGASGAAQWDFSAMQPITISDEQIDVTTEMYSRGTASGRIAASGGTWDVSDPDTSALEGFAIDSIFGEYPLAGGPGLFVLLGDGNYSCGGSILTYTTIDPVENAPVTVTLHKQ